ncbi:purine-binding chemotaxis protein CheW [Hydrogenophaga palleronii]|uniref:Purine-binding chemotaxis protein CheW n=1 Tax=Hydrogenophaga palleronii TaxID=65655 RepID=A0ABU1WM04_9BURK|nr:chemotaxis protein CheW [Hydrogenophaga palleronii]MDR7150084.1 purine-binding chemotaxis protein CheW [Hydrogenophaga palleronii]
MTDGADALSPPASTAEARQILRARAQALARPPESTPSPEAPLELLEFHLARERYALETRYVRGVHPLKHLTPLPSTPPFILGIVNVRGRIVPVYDIRKFFGPPESGLTDLHRIILVGGNDLELGLLADVGEGVLTIAAQSVQPPPPTFTGIGAHYLKGITAERLVVLDIDRILTDPDILVHQDADS